MHPKTTCPFAERPSATCATHGLSRNFRTQIPLAIFDAAFHRKKQSAAKSLVRSFYILLVRFFWTLVQFNLGASDRDVSAGGQVHIPARLKLGIPTGNHAQFIRHE